MGRYKKVQFCFCNDFQAALDGIRNSLSSGPGSVAPNPPGSCVVCSQTEETLALVKKEASDDPLCTPFDPQATPFVLLTSDFPGGGCTVRFKLYKVLKRIVPGGESVVCPVCLDTVARIDRLEQQETLLKDELR